MENLHKPTVDSFGVEWTHFDQMKLSEEESYKIFQEYFSIFPWDKISSNSEGFDMGCGTGRWAKWVAPRVGLLNCLDPSLALDIAKKLLHSHDNIRFYKSTVDYNELKPCSQDFGYSLGVLHHVPDTNKAIQSCVNLLKEGAPFLLYLYYSFENRPIWFRYLWILSNLGRKLICQLPAFMIFFVTDLIALTIYLPLAKLSKVCFKLGLIVHNIPLNYYRNHSFYTMRTDSRDRFGTPLEKRFTRNQIISMMQNAGLTNFTISENLPYWCVLGYKKSSCN